MAGGGHDNAGGLRWLLTYADMITLLTVFFVVLYSMAKGDVAKYAILAEAFDRAFHLNTFRGFDPTTTDGIGEAPGNLRIEDMGLLMSRLDEYARELGFADAVRVAQRREGVALSLSDRLLFASGTADLRPEGRQILGRVADVLRSLPNRVRIEGHTDDIPFSNFQFRSNWELSAARALAMLRFMESEGVPAEHLSYAAFGEYRPVAPNDSREGRARNRRADIVVLDPPQQLVDNRQQIAPLLTPALTPGLEPGLAAPQ